MSRDSGAAARALVTGLCVILLAGGCTHGSLQSENLAADQTLTFGIGTDVDSLDPAHISGGPEVTLTAQVFTGLYRFDDKLNVVPNGATGMPTITDGGKTWTFSLRTDVRFSNGDRVTASDWVWSWTRTLRLFDAYSSNLEVIEGATEVEKGLTTTLRGLSAPNDHTLVARLSAPAGYWLSQLAMPVATLVLDRRVIESVGDDHWTDTPETYIGSGPYRLTARVPKQSLDFEAVPGWWGTSKPVLTRVHIDVGIDDVSRVQKFETDAYGVVGMAGSGAGPDDILRYKTDPAKSRLLKIYAGDRTTAIGFNFLSGPFAANPHGSPGELTNDTGVADPGLDGRRAFSMAIDRTQLADIACAHTITCVAGTGGPITKGFKGNLGDGMDPYSRFDPAEARDLYRTWDPDGRKVRGLQYRYNQNAANDKVAQNLQAQWLQNLGVNVELAPSDLHTLLDDMSNKRAILFRQSWVIDYDHPEDWFDNLFSCMQARLGRGNGTGYCRPGLDRLVQNADGWPIEEALPAYIQAAKTLADDVVWATLAYGTQTYLTQTWVKGSGYSGLYDFPWTQIRILQH